MSKSAITATTVASAVTLAVAMSGTTLSTAQAAAKEKCFRHFSGGTK